MAYSVGIIGAGSWGTALAITVHYAGHRASIWSRNASVVDSINQRHENSEYLAGVGIPPEINATTSLEEIVNRDILILAVPAQHLKNQLSHVKIAENVPLVIASKGIEQNSLMLMSEAVSSILPNPIAIISGPNFAKETALLKPTATTIACENAELGEKLLTVFGSKTFRPYLARDIITTQIAGAVKNVIAIACGISEGKELGDNSKSAIITRSIAEIKRLCLAKGGQSETLMGLAGIGDLILTCSSRKSRNMSLGYELGQGKELDEILATRNTVAEGVTTAKSVFELAKKLGVEMPICEAVYSILYEKSDINETIIKLLNRPYKNEH